MIKQSAHVPEPRIRKTLRGPILDFEGKWKPEYAELIHRYRSVGIRAGFFLNEYENDFSFLKNIPQIQYFAAGVPYPFDPEPLYCLKDLRYLWIMNTHTMQVDFSQFSRLEAATIPWSGGMASLFHCASLKNLFLKGYRSSSSEDWGGLKNLEALDLRNCTVTEIDSVAELTKLKKLRLALLPRLKSLAPLRLCDDLEVLHIGRCGKATDINAVRYLRKLRYLILTTGKAVDSLEFVKPLTNLRLFNFDFVVKNGDLGVLLDLPNLAETYFPDKRHYSQKSEEIRKSLALIGRKMTNQDNLYGAQFGFGIDDWVLMD